METPTGYGKVDESVIAALAEIVGGKNVLTGEAMENYSRDETTDITPVPVSYTHLRAHET